MGTFAGLLPLGHWQLDEYEMFSAHALTDGPLKFSRLAYSPRPFSETLLFLYGEAVTHLRRPLVVSFLAFVWAGTLAALCAVAWRALPPRRGRLFAALSLAMTPIAFLLVTMPVTEVFFWPAACAAYLPTIGAASALLFLSGRASSPEGRRAMAVALGIAATSSEMGAALAAIFAVCVLVGQRRRLAWRQSAWWIGPGLLGLLLLGAVVRIRVFYAHWGEVTHLDPLGVVLVLVAAPLELLAQLAAFGGPAQVLPPAAVVASRLLLGLGVAGLWRQADPNVSLATPCHAYLVVSLLGASLFTVVGAHEQFGSLCCERHAVARSHFIDLVAIAAAILLCQAGGVRVLLARAPAMPALLMTASLFPLAANVTALRAGYANLHWAISARTSTWESGMAPGIWMQFHMPPDQPGLPIHGAGMAPGVYFVAPGAPRLAVAMGRFFYKSVISACQPWQDDKSWLLGDLFIPACPPDPAMQDAPDPIHFPP